MDDIEKRAEEAYAQAVICSRCDNQRKIQTRARHENTRRFHNHKPRCFELETIDPFNIDVLLETWVWGWECYRFGLELQVGYKSEASVNIW